MGSKYALWLRVNRGKYGSLARSGESLLAHQAKEPHEIDFRSANVQKPNIQKSLCWPRCRHSKSSTLRTHLSPVTLKSNRNLHDSGEIDTVYFLEAVVSSVVVRMENGTTVEVGLVGQTELWACPPSWGAAGHRITPSFNYLDTVLASKPTFCVSSRMDPASYGRAYNEHCKAILCRPLRRLRVIASMNSKSAWLGG
jgi:hypothetical protein